MGNKNGIYPETGPWQVGVIYNLECRETRKEILQKSVNDQSEEGMLFSNEQSELVLNFFKYKNRRCIYHVM